MAHLKPKMQAAIAVFALCLCAIGTCAARAAHSDDEARKKEVNKVFDDYVIGWRTSSVEILSKIYANDAKVSAYWPDPSRPALLLGWSKIAKNLQEVFDRMHEVSPYGMDLDFNDRIIDIYGDTAVLTS